MHCQASLNSIRYILDASHKMMRCINRIYPLRYSSIGSGLGAGIMRRFVMACVVVIIASALPQAAWAAPSTKQVWALINEQCSSGQTPVRAQFTINNIGSPPSRVSVNTKVSTFEAGLTSFDGSTATYDTPIDAAVKSAFAYVPSNWQGWFKLSALNCKQAKPPTIRSLSTGCGVTPQLLTVKVTNNTNSFVTYTVTVGRFPERNLGVSGKHTESIDFGPIDDGDYPVAAHGNDGTSARLQATIAPCGIRPTSTPSKVTPRPSRSASPSASPKPSPSATSATPQESTSPPVEPTQDGVIPGAVVEQSSKKGISDFLVMGICAGGVIIAFGAGLLVLVMLRRPEET